MERGRTPRAVVIGFHPIVTAILLTGFQVSAATTDLTASLASEMTAPIQMEAGHWERGQTIQSLIKCLQEWTPGDGRPLNDVVIRRTGGDSFIVQTNLRSPSYFHFLELQERGVLVAVLVQVEYLKEGKGYQHATDSETKRIVMQSICPS
jgi:hypothetical protein